MSPTLVTGSVGDKNGRGLREIRRPNSEIRKKCEFRRVRTSTGSWVTIALGSAEEDLWDVVCGNMERASSPCPLLQRRRGRGKRRHPWRPSQNRNSPAGMPALPGSDLRWRDFQLFLARGMENQVIRATVKAMK